jgi:hypothetical protein
LSLIRRQLVEQRGDLGTGPLVEHRVRRAPGRRQPDDLPPRVGARALPADQPVGLEAAQDPAQVSGVDIQFAPQPGHLHRVPLRQLEDDPRLGERVRRVQQTAAQHPDHVGIEAVEVPHGGDEIPGRRHASTLAKSLTESTILSQDSACPGAWDT